MSRIAIAGALLAAHALMSCTRLADPPPVDYTAEVEQICSDFCEMQVMCHEPQLFETTDECEALCHELKFAYDDTDCGAAVRDFYACLGATTTCEMYNDANNVGAEDYTCKQEKDHLAALVCGNTPEASP